MGIREKEDNEKGVDVGGRKEGGNGELELDVSFSFIFASEILHRTRPTRGEKNEEE